ncbi:MAG: hypothetical protein NDJ90_12855 [Oligoflexia bacterium]|nr:hypothetical protein [Oligoflexia bacterium]
MKKFYVWFTILPLAVSLSHSPVLGRESAAPLRRADAESLYLQGVKEFDAGSIAKAEALFLEALREEPGLEKARFQLAAGYHLVGKEELALRELKKIKRVPDVVKMVPLLKGDVLLSLRRWEEALSVWKALPVENPDLKAMRFQGMAKSYEGLGKGSEAADSWTSYMELQVRPSSQLFQYIAVNRVKAGEREKALRFCGSASYLKANPSYESLCKAHVFHAAFEAGKSLDDKRAALAEIQQAVNKDKRNLEAADLLERWKRET